MSVGKVEGLYEPAGRDEAPTGCRPGWLAAGLRLQRTNPVQWPGSPRFFWSPAEIGFHPQGFPRGVAPPGGRGVGKDRHDVLLAKPMSTISAKPAEVVHEWFVIDATDKVLGRVASEVA